MAMQHDAKTESALVPVWTALFERDIPAARAALAHARKAPPELAMRLQAYVHLFMGEFRECADILTAIAPWQLSYLDRRALLGVIEHGQALDDHDRAAASIEFLARCGEMSHVAQLLEKATERYGETPALAGLALAAGLALSGNAQLAVHQARVQLQSQRQSALTFRTLGRALLALGQNAQALQALELGTRLYGDEPDALFLRSLALDRLARPEEALALLQPLASQPPAHPLHVLATARLLRRLGRQDEARRLVAACDADEFLPLCGLMLALTPPGGRGAPDFDDVAQALAQPCTTSLEADRYWPDFATQLDLQGLSGLRPALLARVRQRFVAIFPALGTATGVRGSGDLGRARRIGIHLAESGTALMAPLLEHLRSRTAADCEVILIHDQVPLGEKLASYGPAVGEHCVPGVPAPVLTKVLADMALDALLLVQPQSQVQGFALSLARLAPLQIVVDREASALTGATIDAHCCMTDAGWRWTTFAACSVYGDSPPGASRLGLPGSFRVPLTLSGLAHASGGRVCELRPARQWNIPAVQELGQEAPTAGTLQIRMQAPSAGHVLLQDVQVWNGETAFWHPETDQIAHEASFHHDRARIASVSRVNRLTAQMLTSEVDHAFQFHPLPPVTQINRAIVVRSKASSNYFHWLFEGLAALESVIDDPDLADWPVLIDENLHPNLEEALRRVAGPHRRMLRQPQGAPIFLQHAAAGYTANRIPYTLHPGAVFQPDDYVFCPQTLAFLRRRLMGPAAGAPGHRRLFLRRRGGYRHLLNQEEFEALFVEAGFEVIDPGTMDLPAQIKTFSQASHIAGPTGAAFTNLLFAPPGTRILLFTNEATGHHFFSNLATSLGQRMTVIHGQATRDSHPEAHQSDYALSRDLVEQALAADLPPRRASGRTA